MVAAGRELMPARRWVQADASAARGPADLVLASYVLGELDDRRSGGDAVGAGRDTIAFVEPGTPAGYRRILAARAAVLAAGGTHGRAVPARPAVPAAGGRLVPLRRPPAPLQAAPAGEGVERGFEDEKYSYAVLSREPVAPAAARIIRPPQVRSGHVNLVTCEPDGIHARTVSRKQGAAVPGGARRRVGRRDRSSSCDSTKSRSSRAPKPSSPRRRGGSRERVAVGRDELDVVAERRSARGSRARRRAAAPDRSCAAQARARPPASGSRCSRARAGRRPLARSGHGAASRLGRRIGELELRRHAPAASRLRRRSRSPRSAPAAASGPRWIQTLSTSACPPPSPVSDQRRPAAIAARPLHQVDELELPVCEERLLHVDPDPPHEPQVRRHSPARSPGRRRSRRPGRSARARRAGRGRAGRRRRAAHAAAPQKVRPLAGGRESLDRAPASVPRVMRMRGLEPPRP